VHPGAGNHNGTLVNALLNHCQGSLSGIGGVLRPGIVHRLDKETSGLMLVAKGDQAHIHLTEQFQNKSIFRIYHALAWGVPYPASGTIDLALARDTHNRTKMSVKPRSGKPSITHYNLLEAYKRDASLIECKLETGRTHQIRVHLCTIGHSLIGDPVYKSPGKFYPKDLVAEFTKSGPFPHRQALHAKKIQFIHPISKNEMVFESDYPEDFKEYLKILLCHI
jgi:23S rRNA pseudouridine1911/1915/1917 synthase